MEGIHNCIYNTRKGKRLTVSNYRGIPLLLTSNKILANIILGRLNPYLDEIIGTINVVLDVTDLLLTIFSILQIVEKK